MKILHVTKHFHPCRGGIESYVKDLCLNLQEKGHISDVCCLNKCQNSQERLSSKSEYKGIKIFRIPFIDLKYYQIAPGVLKLIKNYDIVHIHGLGFFSDLLTLSKPIHQKPLIFSTHGGIFHTKAILPLKKIYFNIWLPMMDSSINKNLVHSVSDREMFSDVFSDINYVPISFNYEKFNLEGEKERKSLLFVGRISKVKGLKRLIQTIDNIEEDFKLYVVGSGKKYIINDLKNLVEKLSLNKKINFVGEKTGKHLLKYYKKSQFFVSASKDESFGVSTIEGMTSGCIPILNDIPAFRNFVDEGENGFIVDFNNVRGSANKIREIINMKIEKLDKISKSAKKTARKYDWENTIKEIIENYEEVLYG